MPNEPFDPSHDDPLSDEALLRALTLLERGDDPQDPDTGVADPELAAALGALAALAHDTEAMAPSLAGRQALLRAAAAEGSSAQAQAQAQAHAPPQPLAFPHLATAPRHGDPADVTLRHETVDTPPSAAPTKPALERPRPSRRSWAAYAVAAVLLGCMLGLGYFAGMLQSARDTIERQRQELTDVRDDVASLRSVMSSTQRDLETTRSRLEMVTLTARQAYPLNVRQDAGDASDSTEAADAKGIVYVCGQHQQWLLSLTGLKQPPAGELYRLWFMTEDGPVDGGVLDVDEHGDAAAEDLSMPRGTRGFSVSLEPADEPVSAPHELILLGDDPVRL